MLKVTSEIKRLRKVLLHYPGEELSILNKDNLQNKLFDEIPDLDIARKEHDFFASLLKDNGVEVVYLEDLMADVLCDEMVRDSFIRQYLKEAHCDDEELYKELIAINDSKELVLSTMSGLKGKIEPLPNLYFTRDAFTIIGDGIALYHMHTDIRDREVIYGEYINKYHPDFKGRKYYERTLPYQIEGGDVLLLSDEVIAVGVSERTTFEAVKELSGRLLNDSHIRKILAVKIPSQRSCMHLDTVLTMLSENSFTVYDDVYKQMRLKLIDERGITDLEERPEKVLGSLLGRADIEMLRCDDKLEQWNDACNALCISPNRFIVYEINEKMNKIYEAKGAQIIKLPSSELLKGRGGPHCMSMPLVRD